MPPDTWSNCSSLRPPPDFSGAEFGCDESGFVTAFGSLSFAIFEDLISSISVLLWMTRRSGISIRAAVNIA
jgi:hypothetical protein